MDGVNVELVEADFHVEVRASAAAGATHFSNELACGDGLVGLDQ